MKLSKAILAILILLMFFSTMAFAQNANFTTNKGMTIGFGFGGSFQTSEIKNSIGGGFDFSLGHHIFMKENALLAVDWKFRFLAGENSAHDHRINTDNTFSNINFRHFDYDLELGLTLNRFREQTRIVVTGFAGAGITHGITHTDLNDSGGNLYDYSVIDPGLPRSQVYADLLELSDKDYETALNNKAAVMPTAGIYIGYQFSRSFSMGIQHKINFSLSENNSIVGIDIDNRINTGSMIDMNHYTSLGFRWNMGGRSLRTAERRSTTYVSPVQDNYITNNIVRSDRDQVSTVTKTTMPPVVSITIPYNDPFTSRTGVIDITARVQNVKSKQGITVSLNGNPANFEYNPVTGRVQSAIELSGGTNKLVVSALNSAGRNKDELTIVYNKPNRINPPEILFLNPRTPVTVENNTFSLKVQTTNVASWQDVDVSVNGVSNSNFSFTPSGLVSLNIALKKGPNIVKVSGENLSGKVTESTIVTYIIPVKASPPEIIILLPTANPDITYEPSGKLRARVTNVTTKEEITLAVNGSNTGQFTFDNTTNTLDTRVILKEDRNELKITAQNEAGADSKVIVIIKENRPCPQPVLSYNIVETNRPEATHQLKGIITNVSDKSGITLMVNGVKKEDFQFRSERGEISADFQFSPGSYTIVVNVKNECGEDSHSATVNIEKEEASGIRINPGNAAWQFCLITPRGKYNRENLTDSNFSYSGPASSLYIMPIGGGGIAIVNGKPYNIKPGQYYLFTGNLKVNVSTKNPGSMGHWSVSVEANKEPVTGKGNNRPISPCETGDVKKGIEIVHMIRKNQLNIQEQSTFKSFYSLVL